MHTLTTNLILPIQFKINSLLKNTMDPRTVVITHIKMLHGAPKEDMYKHTDSMFTDSSQVLKTKIAASQFAVAQEILKHPQAVVVQEGLDHERSYGNDEIGEEELSLFSKETFDNDFAKLTSQQREVLVKHHAAPILCSLGLIPKVYPSIDPDTWSQLHEDIEAAKNNMEQLKETEQKWRPLREAQAVDHCIKAAQDAGMNDVLLVFGGGHDFSRIKTETPTIYTAPIDCISPISEEEARQLAKPQRVATESSNVNVLQINQFKKNLSDLKKLLESPDEKDDEKPPHP
ncbi:hypothetical protein B6N58_07420 [Legionella micdadei]|uniref:Uncharacterized protein n=3 Tax=Legionella micdadei TaxID=451 RepID=A0A098GG86_LEGMI|nr:hypothetical protein B6N58_07420 [Legionella micdadei]KTD28407.1 hypothetical protein Lmic_1518 [Legionella micdadei]CEG61000.1 protein of unknown function [Legionella micdadei]SCY70239.1 hypothetical protein SAMN02982997_02568 [Legionella micdadei]